MEGEVGAHVAPPLFLHSLNKKRELQWQNTSGYYYYNPLAPSWNSTMWDWDSAGFIARPSSDAKAGKKGSEREGLELKLGGPALTVNGMPSKRVRSGSPGNGGGGSYPMCQVDDCRADLTGAKDYHRRHKVCEVHSKMSKAMVGKVMQRFCQQCSRFHLLSEFDEGKRSCRRRLAGHNRRRRKSHPDYGSKPSAIPGNQDNAPNGSLDVVNNLLAILARLQGKTVGKPIKNIPPLPDRDYLIKILSKLHPLPAANSMSRPPGDFDLNVSQDSQHGPFEQLPNANGIPTATSTMELLTILSAAIGASSRNNLASLSQGSSDSGGNDKTKITCVIDPAADVNSHNQSGQILPSVGAGRSSCTDQSLSEERSVQGVSIRLPLQLFDSAGDDNPSQFGSSVKYLSSESSNPMEDRSPPWSPPALQELFPVHAAAERACERMSKCREDNPVAEESTSYHWSTPLDLFKGGAAINTLHNHQSQAGYASSSGSDHVPPNLNSDAQIRTGQISFKLFNKDPSNLPVSLRNQILNWLSNSPTEIESYIRPGCIVLSVYLSMPSISWDELEDDLLQRVVSLVQYCDSDFWRNGRFLVRTSRQLASHKEGKIRLCRPWRTWNSPLLTCVSPIAVVSGQESLLVLRGRNLTVPGTKIHCTYMGGYSSKEVLGTTYPGTIYDRSSSETFNFPRCSDIFGRCFIEVENGFKGNSFPVIVADASICQELRVLESEFEEDVGATDVSEDQVQYNKQARSREDVLHFLNELGWLFQKKSTPSSPPVMDFSCSRFKFLFTFSAERDWTFLTKTLLDILVERSLNGDSLSQESLDMLLEIQLLSRALKRRCKKMVDLLLHYSIRRGPDSSKVYLFPPNLAAPAGLTPLHLAAYTQDSEDMVDVLTNDPQEIALNCWNSLLDDNGQSPHAYASMRNNHSYNRVVARKLANRKNGQVSIMIESPHLSSSRPDITSLPGKPRAMTSQTKSCVHCALEANCFRPVVRTRGLLQRPYVHSMLAIAAVCVCVCLFLRGMQKIGSVTLFKWENLDYGPS